MKYDTDGIEVIERDSLGKVVRKHIFQGRLILEIDDGHTISIHAPGCHEHGDNSAWAQNQNRPGADKIIRSQGLMEQYAHEMAKKDHEISMLREENKLVAEMLATERGLVRKYELLRVADDAVNELVRKSIITENEVLAPYLAMKERAEKAEAKLAKMWEVIERLPHERSCSMAYRLYLPNECDCWKKELKP